VESFGNEQGHYKGAVIFQNGGNEKYKIELFSLWQPK
jgi:hypothetical protein